jgi:hypothetical protein
MWQPSEGEVDCRECGTSHAREELDLYGWCGACQANMRRKTGRASHLIAIVIVLPFAIWVLLGGRSGYFPLYAWLLPLAAAYYLGLRIGRELTKGYLRWRRGRDAIPGT